jgi:hypothetical protein
MNWMGRRQPRKHECEPFPVRRSLSDRKIVPHVEVRCPECRSTRKKTYGTYKRLYSYHTCLDCGENFLSEKIDLPTREARGDESR